MVFGFLHSAVDSVINNQIKLNTYIEGTEDSSENDLVSMYDTLIRLESMNLIYGENNSNIKEKLARIFILALEFAIRANQEPKIEKLMKGDWVRVEKSDELDDRILKERLGIVSTEFATLFEERFGLFVIRAILDISILYGYRDFLGIVIATQERKLQRNQTK